MSKKQSFASRTYEEESYESVSISSLSDSDVDSKIPMKRKSTSQSKKKDKSGDRMVICKLCLGAPLQLRALSKHCKTVHHSFYKSNKEKPRTWFEAKKG